MTPEQILTALRGSHRIYDVLQPYFQTVPPDKAMRRFDALAKVYAKGRDLAVKRNHLARAIVSALLMPDQPVDSITRGIQWYATIPLDRFQGFTERPKPLEALAAIIGLRHAIEAPPPGKYLLPEGAVLYIAEDGRYALRQFITLHEAADYYAKRLVEIVS